MKNDPRLLLRTPRAFFLLFDLPFTFLVLFAYLHVLGLSVADLTAEILVVFLAMWGLKSGIWLTALLVLMRPLRQWVRMRGDSGHYGDVLRRAGVAVYDLPLKSAFFYGLSWALPILLLAGWLTLTGARIVSPGYMMETGLFSLAVFGGGLLFHYFFLTWALAFLAEEISLEARRREVEIPWRGYRLRTRLVALTLFLALPPVFWVGTVAYDAEVQQNLQRLDLRVQIVTSLLAGTLERDEALAMPELDRLVRIVDLHETERSLSFGVDLNSGNVYGDASEEYFQAEPSVLRWVHRVAADQDAGLFRFGERNMSLSFQRVTYADTPLIVGTVAWRDAAVSPDFLLKVAIFSAVLFPWLFLTAFFLSKSFGGALDRISSLVHQIAMSEDARQAGRVPILQQDEVGRLAESVNFMTDRLAASKEEQNRTQQRIASLAEAYARQAGELRAVLDNMVEAVMVSDNAGGVTLANQSARKLFDETALEGLSLTELAHRYDFRDAEGSPIAPEDHPLRVAGEGTTIIQQALSLSTPAGVRLLRVTAAPVHDEQGRLTGALAVSRDVTELHELDRMKDQFIIVAAHELKTPVAIVKGYAQLLHRLGHDLSEPNQRLVNSIDAGADRIDRIVNDLLDISQLYVNRLHFVLQPTNWSALIRDGVTAKQKETSRHHLRWKGPPEVWVDGDPARLRQVGSHLLSNAVKYSPEGGDIDVELVVEDGTARLSVRDQGIGIPAQKQSRLFESFYRAHTDTPYDYGGMGVGLYISREIMQRHHGQIWFESEEGEGSTFSVRLPLTRSRHD